MLPVSDDHLAKQIQSMKKNVELVKAELKAYEKMSDIPPEDRFVTVMTISSHT